MSFEVVATSFRAPSRRSATWQSAAASGLLGGVAVCYFSAVGLLQSLHQRWLIGDVVTVGQALVLLCFIVPAVHACHDHSGLRSKASCGLMTGALAGLVTGLLAVTVTVFPVRTVLIAVSPTLLPVLTFGSDGDLPLLRIAAIGTITGGLGGLWSGMNFHLRRGFGWGASITTLLGLFQELLQTALQGGGIGETIAELIFTWDGLKPGPAAAVFFGGSILACGASALNGWRHVTKGMAAGAGAVLVLASPLLLGNFAGQVQLLVGLYVLMGMGLNIELGLAGLLDLGFVAFFAIGAYTVALLTANSPIAVADWSFWQALPVAVLAATVAGIVFGVPVLRVRGDYLAVATLGFGEIVRILVMSDLAKPALGGPQGILNIPPPEIWGYSLDGPVDLFYLTVCGTALAGWCAWQLQDSKVGRAWRAMRDDEDVAQSLGIDPVEVKLLAYGLGAAFAGVAGAIFAVMLGSIFPHSFQLLISINIVALLIIGGLGSLPGVVLGSAILIGLPELLREFGEYRFLFYGIAMITVMRVRPHGLLRA
jgi:branched-chain amino acid transport system permease protein